MLACRTTADARVTVMRDAVAGHVSCETDPYEASAHLESVPSAAETLVVVDRPPGAHSRERRSIGLRARIWIGCLGGAVIASAGLFWMSRALTPPDPDLNPLLAAAFPWSMAALGILIGVGFAMWLDHNITGHLRGMSRAIATGEVSELRGLPASAGWGELSEVTQGVQALLGRLERAGQEAIELRAARARIDATLDEMTAALERWALEDEAPAAEGPLAPLAPALEHRVTRERDARTRMLDALREIRAGMQRTIEDARETEEQAERGFVEATALLTTVRELQRLGGELEQSLAAAGEGETADARAAAYETLRATATAAIEELVRASGESVEHLGGGLLRVQAIAEQVHVIANRATLIALDAAMAATGDPPIEDAAARSEALRALAVEVQAVTDRTMTLAREVDEEVALAIEGMRGTRERVAGRLDHMPAPKATADASRGMRTEQTERLLARVREMIQDATRKGERLSAAGERASRAAERLARRLEADAGAIEGLSGRIAPAAATPPAPQAERREERRGDLRIWRRDDADDIDERDTEAEEQP
jgi:hypothetical protein